MINALAIQGAGSRTGGSVGALYALQKTNKWFPEKFDVITGDSFGSFIAAMVANKFTPEQIVKIYCEKDFTDFFVPLASLWKARYFSGWANPNLVVKMNKVADYLNKELKLVSSPKLFVNTWDAKENRQIIYCEKKPDWAYDDSKRIPTVWEENAFERYSVGTCITRSMCLPGLMADDPKYMDGGVGDHPALCFLPRQETNLLHINAGFAGLVNEWKDSVPMSAIDRALYAYDVKAALFNNIILEEFPNRTVLHPKVYNYSALDLEINSKTKLEKLVNVGYANVLPQLESYIPPR